MYALWFSQIKGGRRTKRGAKGKAVLFSVKWENTPDAPAFVRIAYMRCVFSSIRKSFLTRTRTRTQLSGLSRSFHPARNAHGCDALKIVCPPLMSLRNGVERSSRSFFVLDLTRGRLPSTAQHTPPSGSVALQMEIRVYLAA
jgi:hypothetical protein